jgi:hypothetical protein
MAKNESNNPSKCPNTDCGHLDTVDVDFKLTGQKACPICGTEWIDNKDGTVTILPAKAGIVKNKIIYKKK